MKHRLLLVAAGLIAFCGTSTCARAQALSTAGGPGSYIAVGGGLSAYQIDYGERVLGGGMVFVDAHPTWRYGVEAEARFLRVHNNEGVTQTSYLVGPHVYVARLWKAQPYAKFLIGTGEMQFPFGYARGTYFAYAPGGGIDVALNDYVSIRAIDVEYQSWPQFTYGELHPYGISVGLTLRLNRVSKYPKHPQR